MAVEKLTAFAAKLELTTYDDKGVVVNRRIADVQALEGNIPDQLRDFLMGMAR